MERLDAGRENSNKEQRLLVRGSNTRKRQADEITRLVYEIKKKLDREDH